ncbi:hypothetical protein DER46DRAFT_570579 [Fusarium sp. MPI-SDFR-AT-0072]|nr:hypothetical protein DER46DRAFT_570579 [Fusarium sp. MPI-SDFR-AT-0072]
MQMYSLGRMLERVDKGSGSETLGLHLRRTNNRYPDSPDSREDDPVVEILELREGKAVGRSFCIRWTSIREKHQNREANARGGKSADREGQRFGQLVGEEAVPLWKGSTRVAGLITFCKDGRQGRKGMVDMLDVFLESSSPLTDDTEDGSDDNDGAGIIDWDDGKPALDGETPELRRGRAAVLTIIVAPAASSSSVTGGIISASLGLGRLCYSIGRVDGSDDDDDDDDDDASVRGSVSISAVYAVATESILFGEIIGEVGRSISLGLRRLYWDGSNESSARI